PMRLSLRWDESLSHAADLRADCVLREPPRLRPESVPPMLVSLQFAWAIGCRHFTAQQSGCRAHPDVRHAPPRRLSGRLWLRALLTFQPTVISILGGDAPHTLELFLVALGVLCGGDAQIGRYMTGPGKEGRAGKPGPPSRANGSVFDGSSAGCLADNKSTRRKS